MLPGNSYCYLPGHHRNSVARHSTNKWNKPNFLQPLVTISSLPSILHKRFLSSLEAFTCIWSLSQWYIFKAFVSAEDSHFCFSWLLVCDCLAFSAPALWVHHGICVNAIPPAKTIAGNWVWQGCQGRSSYRVTNAPKIWRFKTTTIVFVHDSLNPDFEQGFSGQCLCSMRCRLGAISHVTPLAGFWAGQEDPKRLCSHVWHHRTLPCRLFFIMWLKWASSWSSQGIQTSYMAFHFQKRSLQRVKEDTEVLRLSWRRYTVTYVAFYWTKQLIGPAKMAVEGK